MNRNSRLLYLLLVLNLAALLLNVYFGSVSFPAKDISAVLLGQETRESSALGFIILHSRIPASLTAMLCGAALGVCGLLLQSYFRNPLAGPSILGITSGANLAAAICILGFGFVAGLPLTFFALIGSFAILLLLLALGKFVRTPVTLLIVGVLLSYLTSAVITLLSFYTTADSAQSILIWGMGTFSGVGSDGLAPFALLTVLGLALSVLLIKPLNGWMLGEYYAASLGVNLRRTRILTILITGLLAAVTTAYCGPIAFVGLSVPHLARMVARTDNHRLLLPFSALLGGLCTSLCLFLSTIPSDGRTLPVNALTPIFGVPVIVWVILKKK